MKILLLAAILSGCATYKPVAAEDWAACEDTCQTDLILEVCNSWLWGVGCQCGDEKVHWLGDKL